MQKPTPPPLANTAKKTDSEDNVDEGSDVDERNQQDHIDDYTVRPFSCVLVMWSIACGGLSGALMQQQVEVLDDSADERDQAPNNKLRIN